mmetsp:Transcript_44277/g.106661  ORF Transcript_44277/g.106661 Transcript_44277/m.106661 type:complete len:427 (+) Transcript_44277:97-1377(+)
MMQLNIFVKYRVILLIGLFATFVLGAPRFGVRWNSHRALPLRTVHSRPSSVNVRFGVGSRSLQFDTPQTNISQTPNRFEKALNVTGCGLRKWREKVAGDLFFEKKKNSETISKEEPCKRHPWYRSWLLSGIRRFWKGVLHVLQNYGIIWALESIGTEIIHTPVKLVLDHGAHRCPSAYRLLRHGLVSCFSRMGRLAVSVEETLLCFVPVLLCHRFISREERGKQYACITGLHCSSLPRELVYTVILAPIYEELVYRFLFRQVWIQLILMKKWIEEKFKSQNIDEKGTVQKRDDLDDLMMKSWIFPSSVLFGLAHVSNWMPLDRKYFLDEILIFLRLVARKDIHRYPMRWKNEHTLLCSLYQSQHSLVLSLICFVPVYQHLGMMGSIGSHSIHNLIVSCIPNHRYILVVLSVCARYTRAIHLDLPKI